MKKKFARIIEMVETTWLEKFNSKSNIKNHTKDIVSMLAVWLTSPEKGLF